MSVAALVPLLAFAWGVRSEMERRLVAQSEQRASFLAARITADLQRQADWIGARLASLAATFESDPRLRLALRGDPKERPALLDWGETALRLSGLSMLQLQDETGRILSSGHFRNEFDRIDRELPRRLAAIPQGTALVPVRTASGSFLAFARIDSFRVAAQRFTLVGGLAADPSFLRGLERSEDIQISLLDASGAPLVAEVLSDSLAPVHLVTQLTFPLVTSASPSLPPGPARLVLTQSLDALLAARRSLDLWFAAVAGATLLLALGIATLLAARIGRPLARLAEQTELVDLQRLDVDFHSERNDEIGRLSRLLQAMTDRLRASARHLRAAERHAAVGDLARQVNHDIKNGLVPIRNVLAHLARIAEQEPQDLPGVFRERRATLDSGIEYLETLAAHYARLTPPAQSQVCDVNVAVRDASRDAASDGITVQTQLDPRLPAVRCDPVALRRILENLLSNALDSFEGPHGTVTVTTAATVDGIRITVADTGRGMSPSEVERAFHDFHTTKESGTGLGLSIVRRLVRDAGGQVQVESTSGQGSRFHVDLPSAEPPRTSHADGPRGEVP
jgi:signal transduction histidine kinase